MYYNKRDDIPSLPEELKLACIESVEINLKNKLPMLVWYGRYETANTSSVSYVPPGGETTETNGERTGGVGFYGVPEEINLQIQNFYKNFDYPELKNKNFVIQVVTGGNFVGPHTDDPIHRSEGLIYLLKSGGSNVRTKWYEVKNEFSNLEITNYAYIPYSRLDLKEDHCLEENTWHWMNFLKIHSVENQETLRLALWAC